MAASLAAAEASPSFDNASIWHNLTIWTAQHLAFLNMTRLTPSLDDLVLAGPRMVMLKIGRLGSYIPLPGGGIDGLGFQQRIIPEATDAAGHFVFRATTSMAPGTMAGDPAMGSFVGAAGAAGAAEAVAGAAGAGAAAGAAAAGAAAAGAAEAAAAAAAEAAAGNADLPGTLSASASLFSSEGARGLGSLFSYATSKWALCCIATAVILNRTYIFAATRRRVRLPWTIRLLLRALPIVVFIVQSRMLLQSIQCQTSPDFAELRWGDATKHSDLLFTEDSPVLHSLSSALLLHPSDEASCAAVRMIPSERYPATADLRGSLSLLWPLFVSFCMSHFIETLSCAVQGRPVAAETGMTVFEHSLAFAEADAAISSQLGWGSLVSPGASSAARSSTLAAAATAATRAATAAATAAGSTLVSGVGVPITRAMILKKVNTPPEVLLLAFLSAMSHMTSHILGVLNLQSRFRLLSTGFWALCFMGSIVSSAMTFSLDDPSDQSLLRFPTVAIVGFIPHMLVLVGILICCFIYGSALLLAAASQEPDVVHGIHGNGPLTYRERLAHAHANMQANLPMGNLRIGMEMDFYTALLRVGFDAITMASEAVYLNEDRRVNLRPHTWLEDERYNELQELRSRWLATSGAGSRFDTMGGTGLVPVASGRPSGVSSGYARERTAQKAGSGKTAERIRPLRSGIGASERSGRWVMAAEYLIHVGKLILSFCAVYLYRTLALIGIRSQPRWLRRLVQRRKAARSAQEEGEDDGNVDGEAADEEGGDNEWLDGKTGKVPIQRRNQVDVEQEVRRRVAAGRTGGEFVGPTRQEEREIDSRLYQWWLKGGWWGETDGSGDYEPSVAADEDATSVVSTFDESVCGWESTEEEDNDNWEDDDYSSGQRTPTQRSPFISRESTPVGDVLPMGMPELAQLLDPRSPEERAEALALAAHLKSDGVLTRSAFAQFRQRQRAELLATSRRLADFRPGVRLSPEEEAQLLEQILLSRRSDENGHHGHHDHASWATGGAGLGPDGPQCVVCQSAPRTIIVWPCRCLSLCDDCRVSLAMNNFDKCVCCRREVVSFSRIYVP